MKKGRLLFLYLMMLVPMLAEADGRVTIGGIEYFCWDYSNHARVMECNRNVTGHVRIESSISLDGKSYIVDGIKESAFRECTGITSMIIPDGVTSIGGGAFSGCSNLVSVNIPNGLTKIDDSTFSGCSNLTEIVIPSNVTTIGNYAFYRCSSLTKITIPNSVTSIGYSAFHDCSNLVSVNIPNGLTKIDDYTFSGCSSLTGIVIPSSVTTIGKGAFYESGLIKIELPNSVVSVGPFAFMCCRNLEEAIFSSRCTVIESKTFYECESLFSFSNHGGVKKIDSYAFYRCKSLPAFVIYNNVTEIGDRAFQYCSGLREIEISKSSNLNTLGCYAFSGCSSLLSIIIPSKVTRVDPDPNNYTRNILFSGCDKLAHVEVYCKNVGRWFAELNVEDVFIGKNVENISEVAFYSCKKLKTVTFENGSYLKEIGRKAFNGCKILEDIKIPSNVEKILYCAFGGCTSLRNLDFSESVHLNLIDSLAFNFCEGLTKVELPNSLEELGPEVFAYCKRLSKVYIPNSVKKIGERCFVDNVYLGDIYAYMPEPFNIAENVFDAKTYIEGCLYVTSNIIAEKYRETFAWSKFFHIVKIGNEPSEGDGGKDSDNYKGGGGTVTTRSSIYDITATGMGEVVVDKKTKSSGKGWTSSFSGLNMREEQLTVKIAHYPDSGVPFKFIPDAGYMVKQVQFRPEKNGTLKDVTNAIVFDPTISGYTYKAFDKDTGPKLVVTFEKATNPVLSKTKASIEKGKTLTLKATESSPCKTVTWKSSNTAVATVSSSGKVKGIKAGTATITCTSVATGLSSKCKVTIGYVKLDKTEAFVKKGKTLTLTPTVYPTTLADQSVTWSSSDTNIATVSSAGKVKGVKVGTATITCTSVATGLSTTCTVTVGAVTLSKTKAAIKKGKTVTLTAKVYPTTLTDQSVTWSSSDTNIATVTSTGKVKGVKLGTATITCTSVATGLSATCTVTVGAVTLSKTTAAIEKGKTTTLTPKVYPSTLEDKSVTWTSSDTKIATVSSTGKVKGIKYGTATITCTSNATGLSATCTVTVGKVVIGVSEVTIKKSRTVTLIATVYPSTLTDRSVTWESSDTRIATVSSGGKVKGIKAGTVTITCTSVATGLSSTCTVTVLAASGARSMEGDDDETTGIESLEEVPAATEPFDVYDLSGRKVRSQVTSLKGLPAGIYIVNGKKMIIK